MDNVFDLLCEDNVFDLYEHNINGCHDIIKGLKEKNIVSSIRATGTGKSYIALSIIYYMFRNKKTIYIVPSLAIAEHLKEIINSNPYLDYDRDFANLEFRTYQSFVNMSLEEIKALNVDFLVVDEFHHAEALVWGERIRQIIETHKNIKVLGMSAYTVRDRGTTYEFDVVNPDSNGVFAGSVVNRYDLCDAMIDGILPKPIYKSGYVYLEKTAISLEEKLDKLYHSSSEYKELELKLRRIRKMLHNAPSVSDIFKQNIQKNGKYIYFCPTNSEEGKNDIKTIKAETYKLVKEMGLDDSQFEFYETTSNMGKLGKQNRDAFYNDLDLDGNKVSDKLRIMFCISQYDEGVHPPGVYGVIMGKNTQSDIVYFEELGRGLAIDGCAKQRYEELYAKPIEELIELCCQRQIKIHEKKSKKEIVSQLVAPVIIDLVNNVDFIKELETNLGSKLREVKSKNSYLTYQRNVYVENELFDINMINEDLFKILQDLSERLSMTWEDRYNLSCKYYEYHHNLEIPQNFKTKNGYEYDDDGIALGTWINTQRQYYKNGKLSQDKIRLLETIGMNFEKTINEINWENNYNLACKYYEYNRNLEIPQRFKTKNGYEHDDDGIALGVWITNQRQDYKKEKLSQIRIKLLENIGMNFEKTINEIKWDNNYKLACSYYECHRNLEIPQKFKTKNGYEHDDDGIALGAWLDKQNMAYKKGKLSQIRIKLLENIGMNFEKTINEINWDNNYKLACSYYECHRNLEIPQKFKTKNGYEHDDDGITLGAWLDRQNMAYKKGKLSQIRIKLLENIGMNFEKNVYDKKWENNYKLACSYYEYYHNLEIPQKFKTKNGYEHDDDGIALGKWINTQRQYYKNGKLSQDKIKLLEAIKIKWFSDRNEIKAQQEKITISNKNKKDGEILSRFYSLLSKYDEETLPTVEELNRSMMKQLSSPSVEIKKQGLKK